MQSFILDTREQLEAFWEFVSSNEDDIDVVSFDLETDSVVEIKANIYGIGIAFQEEEGFYIPVRAKDGSYFFDESTSQSCMKRVTKLLKSKKVIGHNIIYDSLVWYHSTGERIYNNIHADTILMKHMIEEEPPFGLKEVAVKYLGPDSDKAQEALYANIRANGGTTTKDNVQMFKADTQILGEYCCHDVMLTFKLYTLFSKDLVEQGLDKLFYEEEVMPLYREVTIPMKEKGIPVDLNYFNTLLKEITEDIDKLEKEILAEVEDLIQDKCIEILEEKYPVKKTGNFPKKYAEMVGLNLTSLAKKVIEKLETTTEDQLNFKQWMLGEVAELNLPTQRVQMAMFFDKHTNQNHVFNLRSKDHLKWLFFTRLDEDPLSTTDKGEPQVDDDFLDSISTKYTWVSKLQDLNKLEKIKGTYIEGVIDRAVDGVIYASMLQFGTTSGRFASRNPNLQNLPRPKEDDSGLSELVLKYNNAIRGGFIAPNGYKVVDADYSALEPRAFAHMSGDENLQKIFHTGEDMYSAIAKKVFNLQDVSTFKKDPNFLGKLYPEKRQIIKALALAVTYGAEAFRIADLLKINKDEAQKLIDDYLAAYPGLNKYIQDCHYQANQNGYVKTIFGRVRHLPEARNIYKAYGHSILDSKWARSKGLSEERRIYKNKLNNSTNFRIQGLAAHIVNRAMLEMNRAFKSNGIDAWVCLQIHDQVITFVKDEQKDQAKKITQHVMENVVKLSVPLVAEPNIASNFKDSH
jgi:DNA polymerase I-like protein with 3'-5' exonuclease and polymerase domains